MIVAFAAACGYLVIAGLGIIQRTIGPPQSLYLLGIGLVALILHHLTRLRRLWSLIGLGIIQSAVVQLTGGTRSPLFFLYLAGLVTVGYRESPSRFYTWAACVLAIEMGSGLMRHTLQPLPITGYMLVFFMTALVTRALRERENTIEQSLLKYETHEQFYAPADYEARSIVTSVKDIDRHPGIERPLLYYVKLVHRMFNAHSTAVYALNADRLLLVQGFSRSELFNAEAVVDVSTGLYRQVLQERKTVLIADYVNNPEELGYYRGDVQVTSVMLAPLLILDHLEGLMVMDRKDGEFNEEDRQRFEEAARGTELLLAMVRLYEKERYEARYLSSMADLSSHFQRGLDLRTILDDTVRLFKDLLKCDEVGIASIDELNDLGVVLESAYVKENTKFNLDDGLVGMVARHKSHIVKDNLAEGNAVVVRKGEHSPRGSFIGLPIRQNDEVLGVIWFEDHRTHRFTEDDARALNILSSQLSLAWQRAILYERIKEMAIRDGLTGLYNHRHFQEVLEQQLAARKELVLLMFDIDHFKKVNDTYGHLAGDEVLKSIGRLIYQTGISARYGGEEFAIILPGQNLKKGAEVAVRLKDHLKKNEIKFNQTRIRVTLSIGIAHFPKDAESRLGLIEKADRALYQAKETGRDKVVIAQTMDTR